MHLRGIIWVKDLSTVSSEGERGQNNRFLQSSSGVTLTGPALEDGGTEGGPGAWAEVEAQLCFLQAAKPKMSPREEWCRVLSGLRSCTTCEARQSPRRATFHYKLAFLSWVLFSKRVLCDVIKPDSLFSLEKWITATLILLECCSAMWAVKESS